MFKFLASMAFLIMLPIQSQAADTLQDIEQKFQGDFELVSYIQFPEQLSLIHIDAADE